MATPRHALVTGAARRIGRAVALGLAADGWAVAVHYNGSADAAEAVVGEIAARGGRAVALQCDLADEPAVRQLLPQAEAALGPIGCLVNNASRFDRDQVGTVTRASWDAHMETNLRAPFVLCQAMAAALPPDAEGAIVNMTDQRVWNLTPDFTSYTVSKAGLWTLTQTLALALAPRIRVNAIGPGPTLQSAHQTEAQFRRQSEAVPLRRGGTPAEIVEAVRFVLRTPSLTGQMIALDGGEHLGWAQAADGITET